MKIAIESNDGKTLNSPFVPPKGYIVYDIEDVNINGFEYRKKTARKRAAGRKSTKPLLEDCKTIISRGMDNRNIREMKRKGLDVFITFNTQAKDALRAYIKESLLNRNLVN